MTARADMIFDTGSRVLWRAALRSPSRMGLRFVEHRTASEPAFQAWLATAFPDCEVVRVSRQTTPHADEDPR